MVALVALSALLLQKAAHASLPSPLRQQVLLFVDPDVVACSDGWDAVVPPAQKDPASPMMTEKEIWEVRWDNTYPTTRWDETMGKFRMWYGSTLSCDRTPKPGDARPNTVDGCGHPTWHQQYPDQVPMQTQQGLSGILYAESANGLNWTKPPLNLIPYGPRPGEGCTRVGRGPCIVGRAQPPCLNGSFGGGDLERDNLTLPQAVARCRSSTRCAGFSAAPHGGGGCPDNATVLDFHFKDAYGTRRLGHATGWHSWADASKGSDGGAQVNNTNIIAMHTGGDGILFDERDANASRRYKLFGGIDWQLCTSRPASNTAVDGTAWPPCHLTGADYSADGVHFEHGYNESTIPTDQFYDVIGQNDGTLDVAIWDEHLGYYWGLVRIDAGFVGRPGIANANPRRTGRFTTPDMRRNFSAAVQVFNGTADYQIYMVLPFRLPNWRPGYYLATASFLLLNQTVRTELLQSTDHGLHWKQIAPGSEFIPLGPEGAFDSYTTYTSWSGTSAPLLDPTNPNRTMFYYSGGNGPHDGQRDDSIGLAYAPTHGYAGLRSRSSAAAPTPVGETETERRQPRRLRTAMLRPEFATRLGELDSAIQDDDATAVSWEILAALSRNGDAAAGMTNSRLRVRLIKPATRVRDAATTPAASEQATRFVDVDFPPTSQHDEIQMIGGPRWVPLPPLSSLAATGGGDGQGFEHGVAFEFECDGDGGGKGGVVAAECTVFALRATVN